MNNKMKIRFLTIAALICSGTLMFAHHTIEAAENPMKIIWEQSVFNPHLNDSIVKTEDAIVSVNEGKLQGSKNEGVFQFLGIPYAEAKKRFMKADSVMPWRGIKDATHYGKISPQKIFGREDIVLNTSNNCLNLNIWTTSLNTKSKKPVMVWLHRKSCCVPGNN